MSDFTPCILTNEPEAVYHARKQVSNSMLKVLHERSAYHFWAQYIANPPLIVREETPALGFGAGFHCQLLEPDNFDKRFYVMADVDGRTKEGKAAKAAALEAAGERTIIKDSDYESIQRMTDAVRNNRRVADILAVGGHAECTMLWRDDETGVECRGRADWLGTGSEFILDFKSCLSASPRDFGTAIARHGYHRQGVMYPDGAEGAGIRGASSWPFVWVAVENTPPYHVELYTMQEMDLTPARDQYKHLLRRLKHHHDTNTWPGYVEADKTFGVLNVPSWALSLNNNQPLEQI